MNVRGAAEYLGVSVSYLNKLRISSSDGPQFCVFGRSVRYSEDDLRSWAAERKRRSTTTRGGAA